MEPWVAWSERKYCLQQAKTLNPVLLIKSYFCQSLKTRQGFGRRLKKILCYEPFELEEIFLFGSKKVFANVFFISSF